MKRIVALLLVLVMVLLPGCRKADRWEEAVDRGRSHLLAEEFMEAIEAFKEAIGIDPDRPEAYKLRGDAWLELAKQALEEGEFEDAEDYLDEAEDDYDRAERRDYDDPDELDDLRDEVEILEDRAEAHDVGPGGQNPDGGRQDTKKLYKEFFYSLYNDNDFVALADVTGDGTEEMMVVHLEDPDGYEITGHVYTLQNGAVTEIYTNRGSSVHAGGFYGWYLVERDGGYCLGEEGFGMWQGVGILSFTQYIPAGNGNREVVEELVLNSEDEGNHDEYGMVTQEAYFAYTDDLYAIMEHSYILYATASECGYGRPMETFPPAVFGTMDDAPPATETAALRVEDAFVEVYASPFGGNDYCCHIPCYVTDDDRCAIMNEQIYQDLFRIMSEYPFDMEGYEGQPAVGVNYTTGAAGGVSSIVTQVTIQHSDYWYYRTYNVNNETGWEAMDEEVIAACGYSYEEYRKLLEKTVTEYFENTFADVTDFVSEEEYTRQYVMSTCEETLRLARPFADGYGRLCVVTDIYGFAGADCYPHMICLEAAGDTAALPFIGCPQHS